jgi:hypothetical protein
MFVAEEHHHHHHHGGGHSVVKIVQGGSTEFKIFDFITKFKKRIWIIFGICCIAAFFGYLEVLHHPTGTPKQPLRAISPAKANIKPVENQTFENNSINNSKLRNDRQAGREEKLKWQNARKR